MNYLVAVAAMTMLVALVWGRLWTTVRERTEHHRGGRLQEDASGETFVCVSCDRTVPVEDGSFDCLPEHCDDCWFMVHDEATCLRCERDRIEREGRRA